MCISIRRTILYNILSSYNPAERAPVQGKTGVRKLQWNAQFHKTYSHTAREKTETNIIY